MKNGHNRGKVSSERRSQTTDRKQQPSQKDKQMQNAQKKQSTQKPITIAPPAPPVQQQVKLQAVAALQPPRPPAHMAKVERLAHQLPTLTGDAATLFVAMQNLSTSDLNGLQAHLNVEIRRRGVMGSITAAAVENSKLEVGNKVVVRSGNAKLIGQSGVVTKVNRIRCYARLEGRDRDDYFFISELERVEGPVTAQEVTQTVARLTQAPVAPQVETDVEPVAESVELPEVSEENVEVEPTSPAT